MMMMWSEMSIVPGVRVIDRTCWVTYPPVAGKSMYTAGRMVTFNATVACFRGPSAGVTDVQVARQATWWNGICRGRSPLTSNVIPQVFEAIGDHDVRKGQVVG